MRFLLLSGDARLALGIDWNTIGTKSFLTLVFDFHIRVPNQLIGVCLSILASFCVIFLWMYVSGAFYRILFPCPLNDPRRLHIYNQNLRIVVAWRFGVYPKASARTSDISDCSTTFVAAIVLSFSLFYLWLLHTTSSNELA